MGLAEASTARTKASRANLEAVNLRNFDSSTFEAWFTAYTVGNRQAMTLAERRFRPEFRVAFDAWRATKPETNPKAPKGPTYMPQYRQPGIHQANVFDAQADEAFAKPADDGETSDKYVRTTVLLAEASSSSSVSARASRDAVGARPLVGLGAVLLVVAIVQLTQLPGPPT